MLALGIGPSRAAAQSTSPEPPSNARFRFGLIGEARTLRAASRQPPRCALPLWGTDTQGRKRVARQLVGDDPLKVYGGCTPDLRERTTVAPSTTTKTQTQKVAVPVDLLAKIKPIAAANRRTMTAEVAVALEQYVRDAKPEVK